MEDAELVEVSLMARIWKLVVRLARCSENARLSSVSSGCCKSGCLLVDSFFDVAVARLRYRQLNSAHAGETE